MGQLNERMSTLDSSKYKYRVGQTFENGGSPFIILKREAHRDEKGLLQPLYTVKFLNTGNIRTVKRGQMYHVCKCSIEDRGENKTLKVSVGMMFDNNGNPFTIIDCEDYKDTRGKLKHNYTIKFVSTGSTRKVSQSQLYGINKRDIPDTSEVRRRVTSKVFVIGKRFENGGTPFILVADESYRDPRGKLQHICTIKFLSTGTLRRVYANEIYDKNKNILDPSARLLHSPYAVGTEFSNHGNPFIVTHIECKPNSYSAETFTVKFLSTGNTRVISRRTLSRSISSKPLRDLGVYSIVGNGIGRRGANFCLKDLPPIERRMYGVWYGMLDRCYNPNSKDWKRYGGLGVTVDPRWHQFENFKNDIPTLEGYNEELYLNCKLDLDKDLKQREVRYKVYSKDTCVLLLKSDNSKLTSTGAYRITQDTGCTIIVRNIIIFCREHNIVFDNFISAVQRGHLLENGWKVERLE